MRISRSHVALAFAITVPLGIAAYAAYRAQAKDEDAPPSDAGIVGGIAAFFRQFRGASVGSVRDFLPASHAALAYADEIDASAAKYALEPRVVVAIGERESGWGTAAGYSPSGPGGAGDRTPRKRAKRPSFVHLDNVWIDGVQNPPVWDNGAIGFGLGLMQIDAESNASFASANWRDPATNIEKGCAILRGCYNAFPDNELAAFAAYNGGAGNVAKAIAAGKSPDEATTGRDYASDISMRAEAYGYAGLA